MRLLDRFTWHYSWELIFAGSVVVLSNDMEDDKCHFHSITSP